jgi:protein SCO1
LSTSNRGARPPLPDKIFANAEEDQLLGTKEFSRAGTKFARKSFRLKAQVGKQRVAAKSGLDCGEQRVNGARPIHRARILAVLPLWLSLAGLACADQRYSARGLILTLDPAHHTMIVSTNAIPGFMEAMTMPYSVRDSKELDGLEPGTIIDFTLVIERDSSHAEGIRIHSYQGLEPDPLTARRLKLLNQVASPSAVKQLAIGDSVQNFTLTGQDRRAVTFSKFAGKVVALNFVYTRCALPNFCYRSSNNFGLLQKRFKGRLGRDLILLTVTFDPVHDQPQALAKYAATWNADPRNWHFLTGPVADVRRVCDLFGEDFFQEEGLMDHSLRTAVISRSGKLVANLEGNDFSAAQLGDLVETVLNRKR